MRKAPIVVFDFRRTEDIRKELGIEEPNIKLFNCALTKDQLNGLGYVETIIVLLSVHYSPLVSEVSTLLSLAGRYGDCVVAYNPSDNILPESVQSKQLLWAVNIAKDNGITVVGTRDELISFIHSRSE